MPTTDASDLVVWGTEIPFMELDDVTRSYLQGLPDELPSVDWVWTEMDRVWDELQLDNRASLSGQLIGEFYQHPVWVMNGLFTIADDASRRHRRSIAAAIRALGAHRVVDLGGGLGELAHRIKECSPDAEVVLVDPFPSAYGRKRAEALGVRVEAATKPGTADVAVAQDVLEHVEDPIGLAIELAQTIRPGGVAIFANCFHPEIKCHLPRTFYLRHTFAWVMRALGLTPIGAIEGADHAIMYRVGSPLRPRSARLASSIAKPIGIGLNFAATSRRALRARMHKHR